MTQWIDATDVTFEREDLTRRILSQVAPGAIAVGLAALLGAWILFLRPPGAPRPPDLVAITKQNTGMFGSLSAPILTPASSMKRSSGSLYGELVVAGFEPEPNFTLAEREPAAPVPVPPIAPPRALAEDSAPMPPQRPAEFSNVTHLADPAPRIAEPARLAELEPTRQPPRVSRQDAKPSSPDERSVMEKLFGVPHAAQPGPAGRSAQPAVLAYASPETSIARSTAATPSGRAGGLFDVLRGVSFGSSSSSSPAARYGNAVAVYDISAHVVYMPDGTRLEAHSGLGNKLDDPHSVSERMRGATPPATYELTPREALFHGVQALRLTPVEGNVFGRVGLLAHTYMLGPNGDSNGCLSFRDYEAFLRAYHSGQIRKLVVVSSL